MKHWLAVAALALVVAGCAERPQHEHRETPECMNYRAMMTAPMAPDAMKRLQARCEASRMQ
ncbi:putative lipoprotein [Gluconacetobacter diazotrophicus PA1 5]|uniref:Lipoprotein n=1 Tax=Gluconacetobacter diazotrophicus TaxID=33996 RepID=A0A7W4I923_GLUDI|nr:hypothetical protein [Gluconacetobacter diazotrophicus]ACI52175.1 putative lipoprotein [Gluconacetobacter diazotrophicus PA1 5]MBB2158523.1 hypothetical protein [Gluconacetobacter diazotrophicus]TWA97556.1 hypothetical protein FBZ86_1822 [Gluconacetobacter diazotrophicus]